MIGNFFWNKLNNLIILKDQNGIQVIWVKIRVEPIMINQNSYSLNRNRYIFSRKIFKNNMSLIFVKSSKIYKQNKYLL